MARQLTRRPVVPVVIFALAALGVVRFYEATPAPTAPFAHVGLTAGPSINAFGRSREVRLQFALPGAELEFPLEVTGDPSSLSYEWVPTRETASAEPSRLVKGAAFVAPSKPGFYRLVISRGADRQVITEPTLAVLVPFKQRVGGFLNGYRIGTYLADRFSSHDHPDGFLEVSPEDIDLQVSTHLRLGDFLTHDTQGEVWPKYVALNPRLLDKLELVLAKVGSQARFSRGAALRETDVALDVHSGFRTPAHNAGVWSAAQDSRHQYGDAADVAIDANGDGRLTASDERLVTQAVD
ncbi:MAG TPA: D-Ala-D-Ala carboxypeptidase family metallohydrolase, partial [Gemmatimonadaceae bacterium]